MKIATSRHPETIRRPASDEFWDLRLYITGRTFKAMAVLSTLRAACEGRLKGRYRITVIDLIEQPQRACADEIVAIPTIVRKFPKPARTFIGTLSDVTQLLADVPMGYAG